MAKNRKEEAMASDAAAVTTDDDSTALATSAQETGSPLRVSQSESMATSPEHEQALAIANMSDKEQVEKLAEFLELDPALVEAIATGSLPFWPARAGLMIAGTIVGQRRVPTRFGEAVLYTLNLSKPSIAETLDGEVFELQPGDNISVLERTVLQELAMREGQLVGILCAGKKKGSGKFSYWDYKIIGARRTPDQIQAAAQTAMARIQQQDAKVRALPEKSRALPAAQRG